MTSARPTLPVRYKSGEFFPGRLVNAASANIIGQPEGPGAVRDSNRAASTGSYRRGHGAGALGPPPGAALRLRSPLAPVGFPAAGRLAQLEQIRRSLLLPYADPDRVAG